MATLEVPDKRIIIAKAAHEQEEKSMTNAFLAQIIEAKGN